MLQLYAVMVLRPNLFLRYQQNPPLKEWSLLQNTIISCRAYSWHVN